jgi:ubiquinone/menaquinone biosynthesis C-methylase UbiE
MKEKGKELTPPYFRYLVHLIRPFPDFDFSFIKPVRQKAVELLNLKQGDRVLDVGCGPGGSFPYLVRAVGPSGEVVGVEISPEVAINARRRIAKNGWKNVQVIEADARTVHLAGTFDGALMFAAADVSGSQEALENIFPHLRENARVAVFGAKTSNNRLGRILNPVLQMLVSKLGFPTTPRPENEPWRSVAKRVEKLHVEEYFFGLMFLASGSVVIKRVDRVGLGAPTGQVLVQEEGDQRK